MKEEFYFYKNGIGLLRYALNGLDEGDYSKNPGPGSWNFREVLMHLVDCELVFSDRIKWVISEDKPALLKFDENKWATSLFYNEQPISTALSLFDLNREFTANILSRLAEDAWNRKGVHSVRGEMTLEQCVKLCSVHLDTHLKFIYEKRENLNKPVVRKFSRV